MRKKLLSFIIPIAVAVFNILIIFFPTEVMGAAKQGALLWFNNVMPSLLPFFIGTNILIGLGAVDFLGVLLEPVMRPIFGVPGSGGFALAMGMTSGYPVGAKIVGRLREEERLTQTEAQRLISFVNNSGPLFMVGSVGAGMFGSAAFGYFILISNFSAAIITGILFKFYKPEKESLPLKRNKKILTRAVQAMEKARGKDGRPFGKILADSVFSALESSMQIAGFIILFSVLLKIFQTTGILDFFTELIVKTGLIKSEKYAEAAIYGILEVTNGAGKLSELGINKFSAVICAGLISFGGLSIFAQSVAFLSKTDVKAGTYFISKIINGALAAIIAFFLYPLFNFTSAAQAEILPVFAVNPVNQLVVSTLIYAVVLLTILITAAAINITYYIGEKRR